MLRIMFMLSKAVGYCIFAYGIYLAWFVRSLAGPDAMDWATYAGARATFEGLVAKEQ